MTDRTIGVLSGVDFTVDTSLGLAGICDYIITRSTEQMFVEAPVLSVDKARGKAWLAGLAQPPAIVKADILKRLRTAASGKCPVQ